MDELPKCKLCGKEPGWYAMLSGMVLVACNNPECAGRGYAMPQDCWRRLHGPRLAPEEVLHLRACAKWHEDTERLWATAIRAALAALGEGAPPLPAYKGLFPDQRAERLELEAAKLGLERPTEFMIASAINDAVSDVLLWVDGQTGKWHSRFYDCAEASRNEAALGKE